MNKVAPISNTKRNANQNNTSDFAASLTGMAEAKRFARVLPIK
jgi:hypothetical protein